VALRWTRAAYADVRRIHDFLASVDPAAAVRAARAVVTRVRRIPAQPRLGERLRGFGDREVRRVLVGGYEVRYEIRAPDIYVLRIFHSREDR
jgi:plasmid stabilization system protein ParE